MLTPEHIGFLDWVCYNGWKNINGIINANDYVKIIYTQFNKLPIQFGKVNSYFTLECNYFLTSLEGAPKEVKTHYSCGSNRLTNLIDSPDVCNDIFYCEHNQLTSLEGCPKLIKGDLYCKNNPALHILYGIGRVKGKVHYDNCNDLNEWIISQARHNIFSSYSDIAKWIKDNGKYQLLYNSSNKIRNYFSKYVLNAADIKIC